MVRVLALVALGITQVACGNSGASCSEQSDSVALGRSFTQQEYELMFLAIEGLSTSIDNPGVLYPMDSGVEVPEVLGKLKPQKISLYPKVPRVILEGCLDHFVAMQFKGVDSDEKSIILSWGEASDAGSQVLWPVER